MGARGGRPLVRHRHVEPIGTRIGFGDMALNWSAVHSGQLSGSRPEATGSPRLCLIRSIQRIQLGSSAEILDLIQGPTPSSRAPGGGGGGGDRRRRMWRSRNTPLKKIASGRSKEKQTDVRRRLISELPAVLPPQSARLRLVRRNSSAPS